MNCFVAAGAMEVVNTGEELERIVENLLGNSNVAAELGRRAREVVKSQQGATARHAKLILDTLDSVPTMSAR
jgi:3-deoxy-D-manno-octulosonic-acid transferase